MSHLNMTINTFFYIASQTHTNIYWITYIMRFVLHTVPFTFLLLLLTILHPLTLQSTGDEWRLSMSEANQHVINLLDSLPNDQELSGMFTHDEIQQAINIISDTTCADAVKKLPIYILSTTLAICFLSHVDFTLTPPLQPRQSGLGQHTRCPITRWR